MKKFDFHTHTCCSKHWIWGVDGLSTPREIVETAISRGLDGVAVSDHNTTRGGLLAAKIARKIDKNFLVIPSIEVKSKSGDVLAIGVLEELTIKSRSLTAAEAVEQMREKGAVIIAPHPYGREGLGSLVEKLRFDALEGFNAHILSRYNRKAKELAKRLKLPMVASSDAHIAEEVANGITGLDINELSIDAVKDAIRREKTKIIQEKHTKSMGRIYSKKIGLLFHVTKRPPCDEI
ncbi:MAG: PHP domain-containing protein [Candidatus Jordarchaeum sp.]|uniref:PHP domain-containing protein n=1 Tax=Candidatus Jordarchaeum sp. TaxID=2823881 RepID=UPI00404A19ED